MDAEALKAITEVGLACGTAIVGVTLYVSYASSTAKSAARRARNVETALNAHISNDDHVYARKDAIDPQFKAISDSLKRIEDRQTSLVDRLIGPGA